MDENLPIPSNISNCSIVQLSYLYNKLYNQNQNKEEDNNNTNNNNNQMKIIQEISFQILNNLSKSTIINEETLCEIIPLSLMNHNEVSNNLLRIIVEKVE